MLISGKKLLTISDHEMPKEKKMIIFNAVIQLETSILVTLIYRCSVLEKITSCSFI